MITKLLFLDINYKKIAFVFLFFFQVTFCFSQNYRTADAYINDFGRNENYINSALMEYSKSIAYVDPEKRVQRALEELLLKLDKINSILNTHDKGFKNDDRLRESLLNVSKSVITYLKNEDNILKDYKEQSLTSLDEIVASFELKDKNNEVLYGDFRKYEETKKAFGEKYNIAIKNASGVNIYEYNTNQNMIFYKLNVLDEKLMSAINTMDLNLIVSCNQQIVKTCIEAQNKTALYRDYFYDRSLNNASILLADFYLNQDRELIPAVVEFLTFSQHFKNTKILFEEKDGSISVAEYNAEVRKFNELKTKFYTTLNSINMNKNFLINSWVITNSDFLKKNINFDITNYRYVDTN